MTTIIVCAIILTMMIPRLLFQKLLSHLRDSKKGVILYGPRQAGKTTLVNQLIAALGEKTLVLNGDLRGDWWESFISRDLLKMKLLVLGYDMVVVDEAQRIPEVGLCLKILLDNFPGLKVVATGSSSLDLASKVSEPLTGRAYSYHLYPISQWELSTIQTPHELMEGLEERLVYGSYPEIFSLDGADARLTYLRNLINSYLYKDLLEFGDVRNAGKIHDLLKLLAFQIGSQVSLSELAGALEMGHATVDRYVDLLEKSFVIFRLSGLSRNLRKEVKKMDKIYFYDAGVRNAIIGNLHLLADRDDAGKLWENFLIVERMKRLAYTQEYASTYFWRTHTGAELDYVEETGGKLYGFEFKYGSKTAKAPAGWRAAYPDASFSCVNHDTYLPFVLPSQPD